MKNKHGEIIDYFYYLATLVLIIFLGVYYFMGKETIIDYSLCLVLTIIVWIVLLNVKMHRDNRTRIERRKKSFQKYNNDKME